MNRDSVSVCMFSNLFPPVVSGSSTQSSSLAKELKRRGHRPFVITAHVDKSTPDHEEIDGVPIYRLPCLRLPELPISLNFPWLSCTYTPSNLQRIEKIFRRHRPDVIHLHNHMFDLSFAAARMRKQFRLPLAITIHTMIRHTNPLYNLLLYPADRIFLRCMVTQRADLLISPDCNMQMYVKEAFPTSPTVVVPYGINQLPEADPVVIERLRKKHNLRGKRMILSLGHVHEVRNRRDLISALPEVLKKFPDIVVVVVGTEATDTPRKLAKQLGVEGAVIFNGPAPYEEIPAYLALAELEAHLFYQDAAEKTSLGIASQEAMAAGKPIISAANPDSLGRGVLKHGENVYLVERGNPHSMAGAIIEILDDPDKRKRIGQAARQAIKDNFSWEVVCRKTLQAYEQASNLYEARRQA
ncbi:MAG: glycosyltransferase family 4 protein [Phycisphaerae bacterium]|nr:glycosyltransferase family 4 protein [Phycisphaerae bacterium]